LINALSAIDGTYTLNLADVYGTDRDFEFTASQLKRLLNTPRAQLNYNEVKAQVVQLMSNAAAAMRVAEKAENVVFDLTSGFATYTVTFANDKNYANMSSANLKAYAIKKYKAELPNSAHLRRWLSTCSSRSESTAIALSTLIKPTTKRLRPLCLGAKSYKINLI